MHPVWPEKNRQLSIKVAQKGFHQKNDFDTFTKIAQECEKFGQINCCPKCKKSPNLATLDVSPHRVTVSPIDIFYT